MDLVATMGTVSGASLSWNDAVLQAVEYNESYQADKALLDKRRQDRNETITALLPQLSAGFGYFRVDDNEAIRSMYSLPVDMTYADVTLKQLIFSDPVISTLRSANRELKSATLELEASRLDVAQETEKNLPDLPLRGRTVRHRPVQPGGHPRKPGAGTAPCSGGPGGPAGGLPLDGQEGRE